jgi:hypothetical protein
MVLMSSGTHSLKGSGRLHLGDTISLKRALQSQTKPVKISHKRTTGISTTYLHRKYYLFRACTASQKAPPLVVVFFLLITKSGKYVTATFSDTQLSPTAMRNN